MAFAILSADQKGFSSRAAAAVFIRVFDRQSMAELLNIGHVRFVAFAFHESFDPRFQLLVIHNLMVSDRWEVIEIITSFLDALICT